MATIRPQPFGGESLDEFDPDYHIANLLEIIEVLTGCKAFTCGSTKCGQTIIVHNNKPKPQFCTMCGNEIDYGTLLEDEFDICPKCKKEYLRDKHDYCEVDGSRLESKN